MFLHFIPFFTEILYATMWPLLEDDGEAAAADCVEKKMSTIRKEYYLNVKQRNQAHDV